MGSHFIDAHAVSHLVFLFPNRESCKDIPFDVPVKVPKEVCEKVPKQKCEKIPKKIPKKVPEEVCDYHEPHGYGHF